MDSTLVEIEFVFWCAVLYKLKQKHETKDDYIYPFAAYLSPPLCLICLNLPRPLAPIGSIHLLVFGEQD